MDDIFEPYRLDGNRNRSGIMIFIRDTIVITIINLFDINKM